MKGFALILLRGYRNFVSPVVVSLFGAGNGCRFEKTCSQYTIEMVSRFGAVKGLFLGAKRLSKCHP